MAKVLNKEFIYIMCIAFLLGLAIRSVTDLIKLRLELTNQVCINKKDLVEKNIAQYSPTTGAFEIKDEFKKYYIEEE